MPSEPCSTRPSCTRGCLVHEPHSREHSEQWADRTGEADPSYLPWAADAVAAYLGCGQDTGARHVIDWVAQRAMALPSRWPKIVVATGQAALAEHNGDRALAEDYFTQAPGLHDELPMPLARAQTLTAFLTPSR